MGQRAAVVARLTEDLLMLPTFLGERRVVAAVAITSALTLIALIVSTDYEGPRPTS